MAIRIVFFGTPQFAVPTLAALLDSPEIIITGVITQPDRPAGRGKKLTPSPVKELALLHNLNILQPEKLKDPDVLPWLARQNADGFVVVAYGGFVPKSIREMTRFGCINLHPSLLPKYRGAAPMQWALMNGDETTGISTMILSAGWDDGDILYQEKEPVLPQDNYGTLSDRLSRKGADLILKSLIDLNKDILEPVPQPEEGVTMAPMIENEACRIDWTQPAEQIHNKVRGLTPAPGAFTFFDETRWKILKTEIIPQMPTQEPGVIITTDFHTIRVAAADAVVEILELQPAGKKAFSAAEYLRGVRSLTGKLL